MSWFSTIVAPFTSLAGTLVKEVSAWSTRRDTIRAAKVEAEVATIRAKAELAAHIVKSDHEWDLAWAGQAKDSWKDEWVLILWSAPAVVLLLGFIGSILMPSTRDDFVLTIEFLRDTVSPAVLELYLYVWGVIVAATFGLKAVVQGTVGSKVEKVTKAFQTTGDDIPSAAVDTAQTAVNAFLNKQRNGK